MSKLDSFKKELTRSLENQKEGEKESKLLFQELINRLETYEEKKELIHHFQKQLVAR